MRTLPFPARALFSLVLVLALWPAGAGAQNIITTVAGGGSFNGPALSAVLPLPSSVTVDKQGSVFIAGGDSNFIFRLDAAGQLTVVAGNGISAFSGDGGPATSASLSSPQAVTLDGSGNLLISDSGNSVVRRVDAATQIITTVAGNGTFGFSGDAGPATSATFSFTGGIAVDSSGNLFIADTGNGVVRRVDATTRTVTTVAGTHASLCSATLGDGGLATSASLCNPNAVVLDSSGDLFIADTDNGLIRRVDGTGTITTVAGSVAAACGPTLGDGGPATSAALCFPDGVTFDGSGNLVISDSGNGRIREVAAPVTPNGVITTVAGGGTTGIGDGGPAISASLNSPEAAAFDASGDMFVADAGNNRIREVAAPIIPSGVITTVAGGGTDGDGGPATSAILVVPVQSAFDSAGNLFIADSENNRVRRVDGATGTITTVAGNGIAGFSGDADLATSASLNFPLGVTVDSSGNVFIGDSANNRVRRVDAVTGVITTIAGGGNPPDRLGDGGPATSARLRGPRGLAVDGLGNLYIADTRSNRIRRVDAATQIITTVAGSGAFGALGGAFAGDGGPATSARLNLPRTVALDSSGNLFIADATNNRIRRVDAVSQIITTVAGNGIASFSGDGGPATSASLNLPVGVTVDRFGNILIADAANSRIRRVDATTAIISTLAGNGTFGFSGDDGPPANAVLDSPGRVAVDGSGNLYFADFGSNRIRRIHFAVAAAVAPTNLDFGTEPLSLPSPPQTVTLANSSNTTVEIFGINVASSNFTEANDCGTSLGPGASCTITVTFTPTQVGLLGATLTIFDNAPDSPQAVQLSGTGVTSALLSLFPTSLSFGNQLISTTSPVQSVTLSNKGSAALTISSIQAGPDFAVGGNCAQGVPINQGSSCSLTVNFAPTKAGSLAESVVISDNAPGSPHVVSVSGTGVAPAPVASLSTPALNFGPQAVGTASGAQTVMVTNAGTAPLNFGANAVTIAPAGNFALAVEGDDCSFRSVSPGSNCVVFVVFQPQASGPLTAMLMFTDNAAGSPQMVQLSGQGLAPLVTLSTTSFSFGAQLVGTASGAQPIILGNAGSATLTIASISLPPGYSETDNCNGSVMARASCVIQVTFAPAAPGSFSGNLVITDNVPPNGQQTVQLSGNSVNFSMAAFPASAQAVAGQSVNYSMTVTPARSFSGMVQFSCAGAPVGANCMVTPGAVSLGGGQPGHVMVTVTTTGRGSLGPTQNDWPPMRGIRLQVHLPWLVWLLTLALVAWLVKTRKRRLAVVAPAVLLAALLLFSVACGGGGASSAMPSASGGPSLTTTPTPPGNYVIVVTASSSGSPTQTLPLTLTVTQ